MLPAASSSMAPCLVMGLPSSCLTAGFWPAMVSICAFGTQAEEDVFRQTGKDSSGREATNQP